MTSAIQHQSEMLSKMSSGSQNMSELLKMVQALSKEGLSSLVSVANSEQLKRQEKIKDIYGQWFCNLVGMDRLYNLPEVTASQLTLDIDTKYPQQRVLPSHLNASTAVRGIMGKESARPFVAVKIELLDPTTQKVVNVVVEVIFKRYCLHGDGGKGRWMESNYVTALCNTAENAKVYSSMLYSGGGMSSDQVTALGAILEGKTIKAPIGDYLIRMAK